MFKVGDLVRCVNDESSAGAITNGEEYVVESLNAPNGHVRLYGVAGVWDAIRFVLARDASDMCEGDWVATSYSSGSSLLRRLFNEGQLVKLGPAQVTSSGEPGFRVYNDEGAYIGLFRASRFRLTTQRERASRATVDTDTEEEDMSAADDRFVAGTCHWCGVQHKKVCRTCQRVKLGSRPAHNCEQRCRCKKCHQCQSFFKPGDVCNNCGNHALCSANACACVVCNSCGSRSAPGTNTMCAGIPEMGMPSCGYMSCCCNCDVRSVFFTPPPSPAVLHVPGVRDLTINPLKRLVGVEIEVDGFNSMDKADAGRVFRAIRSWNGGVVRDGSVSGGYEINTAPAGGDLLVRQLTEISDAIRAGRSRASKSCGYHVHVDARDFSWWDMRKLVALYSRIEMAMFDMLPPSRLKSEYCLPCGGAYMKLLDDGLLGPALSKKDKKEVLNAPKRALLEALYDKEAGSDIQTHAQAKYGIGRTRYYAMNLHSWMHRGTVEFRHHHGVTDKVKLINWAMLCAAIVETANTEREEVLRNWPIGAAGLVALAPTPAVAEWTRARLFMFKKFKKESVTAGRSVAYIRENDQTDELQVA